MDGGGRPYLQDCLSLIRYGTGVSVVSRQYKSKEREEGSKEEGLEGDFGQEMQKSFAALVRAGRKELERELEDSVTGGCNGYDG